MFIYVYVCVFIRCIYEYKALLLVLLNYIHISKIGYTFTNIYKLYKKKYIQSERNLKKVLLKKFLHI